MENINAVTPTKPLKLYAHDGTYGFIDSPYFSDSDDQQIRFFTNNGRGIYLSNLNDDKPQYWDGTNGYPMVYLKESWVSGASWYRLYSDNWLEQGGRFQSNDTANTTVTFAKAFTDTNYTPIVGQMYGSSGDATYWNWAIYTISNTSMIIHNATNGAGNYCIWYAAGQAA